MAGSKNPKVATMPTRPPRQPGSSRTNSYQESKSHSSRKSQHSAGSSRRSSPETIGSLKADSSMRSPYSISSQSQAPSHSSRIIDLESDSESGDDPCGPPQLTEGSIAMLIRLENRFKDVEGMVTMMMDFRRQCGDIELAEEMLPFYLEEVFRSVQNMKTAFDYIQFSRAESLGTEEPTMIENAVVKVFDLVEGVKRDRKDKNKGKSSSDSRSSKNARSKVTPEDEKKQMEPIKNMVASMEKMFDKEDEEARKGEIEELKARLFLSFREESRATPQE